jgi:16S rRNA (guanine527-N7)-methyltransferase
MFHAEHSGHVPRGTKPIDPQNPTPEQELGAARESLSRGLAELHLEPDPETLDRLVGLADLLSRWAPRMNLTGHRGPDAIARRLILDALALIKVLPEFESLADLGSGAGFPGLPIAILYPEKAVVSVEARSRRISFQKTVVRELGLENVEVVLGRIEVLEPVLSDAVVAQAVVPPDRVVELMLPWCRDGGWMAIPGSTESLVKAPAGGDGYGGVEVVGYEVPVEGADRRVWVARKTG